MLTALAIAAALAAPPGFEAAAVDHGCTVYIGEQDPISKIPPVHAECHWDDVDPAALQALLTRAAGWEDFVYCIARTEVLAEDGTGALVFQRHEISGVAARENLVWTSSTQTPAGFVVTWKQSEAPFTPADDAIVPGRNEGSWKMTRTADGGVDLVHDGSYDPAGWVPAWLVRRVQTAGELRVLDTLHGRVAWGGDPAVALAR